MRRSSLALTTKRRKGWGLLTYGSSLLFLSLATACFRSAIHDATQAEILHGTIAYPFVKSDPIGVNGQKEKFVIRSINGAQEYVVEIPGAGEDYNVEIPMANIGDTSYTTGHPKGLASPAATDREVTAELPGLTSKDPTRAALVDKAFGVGQAGGPEQSPSYMLAIAKINELYKERRYEYALIELNNLLTFYPTSPKLHKMKGTLYVKLQNDLLAEKSWLKALELDPADSLLRSGLTRLQEQMKVRRGTPAIPSSPPPVSSARPTSLGLASPLPAPRKPMASSSLELRRMDRSGPAIERMRRQGKPTHPRRRGDDDALMNAESDDDLLEGF